MSYTEFDFIKDSILGHSPGKYIYILNSFVSKSKNIDIICVKHGRFSQNASYHSKGGGCRICSNQSKALAKRSSLSEFIKKGNIKHHGKYSYENAVYETIYSKLIITCPIHGNFKQRANDHLNGYGCPKCGQEKNRKSNLLEEKEVISRFKSIHKDKYDYSSVKYLKLSEPVDIICPVHGIFKQKPAIHLDGSGCPECATGNTVSVKELEIRNYVESLLPNVEVLYNSKPYFMDPYELDIYIPSMGIAIEFNGLRWHSERFQKDKYYHFNKTEKCLSNNIRLLHIWEHYWNIPQKKKIYLSKIKHLLGLDEKIFARKCRIEIITKENYNIFIENNHLEGVLIPYKEMKYIGLFFDQKLVMVAGYGMFYIQSKKVFEWKLQRICSLLGFTIVGGISKLSKYIRNDIGDFQFQITLDTGGSLSAGVPKKEDISLRYWWTKSNYFKTRNQCQVLTLKKNSDWSNGDTEVSYMQKNGWSRIWDAGIQDITI